MTLVLGLNAFHADAAAVLIGNGRILCAAEEERFRRIKHWAGFPSEAIRYCLSDAGVSLSDIDHVAINTSPRAHLFRKIAYSLYNRPHPRFLFDRWRNKKERIAIASLLESDFPLESIKAKYHFVEHHRSHLASAFFGGGASR